MSEEEEHRQRMLAHARVRAKQIEEGNELLERVRVHIHSSPWEERQTPSYRLLMELYLHLCPQPPSRRRKGVK